MQSRLDRLHDKIDSIEKDVAVLDNECKTLKRDCQYAETRLANSYEKLATDVHMLVKTTTIVKVTLVVSVIAIGLSTGSVDIIKAIGKLLW